MRTPCLQAWRGGLRIGLLIECRLRDRHFGVHRSPDGTLIWGGKLTAEERELAEKLRSSS